MNLKSTVFSVLNKMAVGCTLYAVWIIVWMRNTKSRKYRLMLICETEEWVFLKLFGAKWKKSDFGATPAWRTIQPKQLSFGSYTKTEISMFGACTWIQNNTVTFIVNNYWAILRLLIQQNRVWSERYNNMQKRLQFIIKFYFLIKFDKI